MEILRWLLSAIVLTITIIQSRSFDFNVFDGKRLKFPASLALIYTEKTRDQSELVTTSKFSRGNCNDEINKKKFGFPNLISVKSD